MEHACITKQQVHKAATMREIEFLLGERWRAYTLSHVKSAVKVEFGSREST